jgi:hypothetical protein
MTKDNITEEEIQWALSSGHAGMVSDTKRLIVDIQREKKATRDLMIAIFVCVAPLIALIFLVSVCGWAV